MKTTALASALASLLVASAAFASHPLPLLNLKQQTSTGTTIPAGGTTSQTSLPCTGDSDAATLGGLSYSMEIELHLTSQAFTNTPTHTTSIVSKPNGVLMTYPYINVTGLASGT